MHAKIPIRLIARDEPGKFICRLCFGAPIAERRVHHATHTDTIHDFMPGQVFGVVWWQRYSDGRQHRAAAVLESGGPLGVGFLVPCLSTEVRVHAMVDQHGPAGQGGAVDRLLALVEQVRAAGHDPSRLPPVLFRTLSYEILADRHLDTTRVMQCFRHHFASNN